MNYSICFVGFLFFGLSNAMSSSLDNATVEREATCKDKTIVVVGDSFFTTEKGRQGSLESMFKHSFPDFCAINLAEGGARFFGFGKNKINLQKPKAKGNILVIGGGSNDFITCGKNEKCMNKFFDKILSKDLKKGKLIDAINQNAKANSKVFIVYPTKIPANAPESFTNVVNVIGKVFAERMKRLESENQNITWVDASFFMSANEKSHWLEDGYHPSVLANQRLTIAIKQLINSDGKNVLKKLDEGKYITQYRCKYSFKKFGIDDNGVPYDYLQVSGQLSVANNSKLEENAIIFDEEIWKIKNADEEFLRKNASHAFKIEKGGRLFGGIKIYSNSKSSTITSISSKHYLFKSKKNQQFTAEGLHIFKQSGNRNEYHLNIYVCER